MTQIDNSLVRHSDVSQRDKTTIASYVLVPKQKLRSVTDSFRSETPYYIHMKDVLMV